MLCFSELMKLGGKLFFEWDLQMYDASIDEPAKANTSDINEELGQVRWRHLTRSISGSHKC